MHILMEKHSGESFSHNMAGCGLQTTSTDTDPALEYRKQQPCPRKSYIPKGVNLSTNIQKNISTMDITMTLLDLDTTSTHIINTCTCRTVLTNQVTEMHLLQNWCSCENKNFLRRLDLKRKHKQKEKPVNNVHHCATVKTNTCSQQVGTNDINGFKHHRDTSQYIEEYRLYNCLQYQGARGDWVSVTDLANTYYSSLANEKTKLAKQHTQSSKRLSHQPMMMIDNVWQPKPTKSEEKPLRYQKRLHLKKEKTSEKMKEPRRTSVRLSITRTEANSEQKVSKANEMKDYQFFTRPFVDLHKCQSGFNLPSIKAQNFESETDNNDKISKGKIKSRSSKKKDQSSEKIIELPDLTKNTPRNQSRNSEEGIIDANAKENNQEMKTSSMEEQILSSIPRLAYVYSVEDKFEHNECKLGMILPKLQRWISDMRIHRHELDTKSGSRSFETRSYTVTSYSTNSLPIIPATGSQYTAEKIAVYGAKGSTTKKPQKKKSSKDSNSKKVHVQSDDLGNVTKVVVSNGKHTNQHTSSLSEDCNANSQAKVRKLGTSRSGAWESCTFRS